LNNYRVGDPNDWLKFYAKLAVQPITHNIKIIKDAMEQLKRKLESNVFGALTDIFQLARLL